MKKQELLRHVGNLEQLAYIRPVTFEQGRAKGMTAYEVKNGALSYRVLADKCLDLEEFSYRGIGFQFLSKPGLQGRNHYDTHGEEALRSIMGGLMFTAGLENICAPCTVDGKEYPMHGRIRTTPAEHICAQGVWEGEDYILRCQGTMREAELFGENLTLTRKIESKLGEPKITITDTIRNEGFREEPLMLLYHINFGYPFLQEGCELVLASKKVTPRESFSEQHLERWNVMDAPKDNEQEYVFIHELMQDEHGNSQVYVLNDALSLGIKLEFTRAYLPYFMQWKSTASGDYVLGLEPSNSSVYGRPYHETQQNLHKIAPFATEKNVLSFTVLEGAEQLQQARDSVENLKKKG